VEEQYMPVPAKDEAFLADLQRKRDLVAGRLAKINPGTREYEWEKGQLDDLDKGIKRLRDTPRFGPEER
jgi:hypothetical protein